MDMSAVQDVGRIGGDSHAGGEEGAQGNRVGLSRTLPQEPEYGVSVSDELNLFIGFSKVSFELSRI